MLTDDTGGRKNDHLDEEPFAGPANISARIVADDRRAGSDRNRHDHGNRHDQPDGGEFDPPLVDEQNDDQANGRGENRTAAQREVEADGERNGCPGGGCPDAQTPTARRREREEEAEAGEQAIGVRVSDRVRESGRCLGQGRTRPRCSIRPMSAASTVPSPIPATRASTFVVRAQRKRAEIAVT